MQELWIQITQFPVIVYTVLLAIVALYWAFAIIGLLDIELLDFDTDIDLGHDVELDSAESVNGIAGLMLTMGLTGVPVTLVISLLVLIGWVSSYFATKYLLNYLPFENFKILIGCGFIFVNFVVSIPIVARLIRPLRPLFRTQEAISNYSLIGQLCEVTTLEVNETFGQAKMETGSNSLLLKIRADTPNTIHKGSQVIVLDYKKLEDHYIVGSE